MSQREATGVIILALWGVIGPLLGYALGREVGWIKSRKAAVASVLRHPSVRRPLHTQQNTHRAA